MNAKPTMIRPELERVGLSTWEIPIALTRLRSAYELPDGQLVVDANDFRRYEAQIKKGYYIRLVWPREATLEQIAEWCEHSEHVLRLYWAGAL